VETNVPTHWDPAQALWKTKLPGRGHASPIVWGQRVVTVTALEATQERVLLCVDRGTGQILWQETVVKGPLQKLHKENSYASSTPVTDGKQVYAVFRVGDRIWVAAHDLVTGKQIWKVSPGTHEGEWGFSTAPALFEGKVIIDGDGKKDSFLVALDCADGSVVWQIDRPHKGISYSAPYIRELDGRHQMIQCGDRCVTGLNPATGQTLWTVDGPSEEFVATPVYSDKTGLVYISSSWPKQVLLAIRPNGQGNVTETHVVWSERKGAPYIPSLLATGDFLLSVNRTGTAFCYDAATGEVHWQEKLGRHHASPVLINGLAYFVNDEGRIHVIRPGRAYDAVAAYALGEPCYASPAISDGQVFIRGFEHLFCYDKP
jgi:outer membrane protein assembly factor BamB